MIVLDEQLLGRDLDRDIARWYRGPVSLITALVVTNTAASFLMFRKADYGSWWRFWEFYFALALLQK
jgi:hypothetical protein